VAGGDAADGRILRQAVQSLERDDGGADRAGLLVDLNAELAEVAQVGVLVAMQEHHGTGRLGHLGDRGEVE
jgi:hypothetical protein